MLNPDFSELLQLLNDNGVRYLVVGGYAVALHGHPRYTKDLDIWFEASPENARRLEATLTAFGFGSLGLKVTDFTDPDSVIQLGYPPSRVDLLNALPGVIFEDCYSSRVESVIDGILVPFIDLDNLRANKRASARLQDLADLEALQ